MPEHQDISSQSSTVSPAAAKDMMPVQEQPVNEPGCQSLQKPTIQFKLSIGAIDDPLEHEADYMADAIMRMPEQNFIRRKCTDCEQEDKVQRKPLASFIQRKESSTGMVAPDAVSSKINASKGNGSPMDSNTQTFMQSRFGTDFSEVKIHTGNESIQMNRELNAKAFTVGNDIYFNEGQYNPNSNEGKHLLAHELTHTIQQSNGIQRNVIQRYTGCTSAQDTIITDDHNRARTMLSNAITAVSSYNGTTPSKVFNALNRHFNGSTSNAFATWINVNLRFLWTTTWMAGYNCFTGGSVESTWACRGSEYATTFWCVPLVNIRICPSIYFAMSPVDRSTGLIHEWIHKYGCNLDRGYEFQEEYAQNSTFEQLINAESFAHFIRDVQ